MQGILRVIKEAPDSDLYERVHRGSDNWTYTELPKKVVKKGHSKPGDSVNKGQQEIPLEKNLVCQKELYPVENGYLLLIFK